MYVDLQYSTDLQAACPYYNYYYYYASHCKIYDFFREYHVKPGDVLPPC